MKFSTLAAGALVLALVPAPSAAHEAPKVEETTTKVFDRALPNVPGKSLVAAEVVYPPGGATPPHSHPASAFVFAYVLEGEIASAVDEEEPRVYRAGESWYEAPGARHRVSRNASDSQPARLLAIFIVDPGERQLKLPSR
ncbi:MAG TPA: cupin domain-containing protein [Allosphingosinicella sp.]|jgi:quercetin dioxygenase-like cupin family protein